MRWICCLLLLPLTAAAEPELFLTPQFEVEERRDVAYGQGRVSQGPDTGQRTLRLDAYLPAGDAAPRRRPAVVLAFGGGFHRGDRRDDSQLAAGARNSPISAYCRDLARRGFACFSIDYRLAIEDPAPGEHALERLMDPVEAVGPAATDDTEAVRRAMGLPPLDDASRARLWNGILAAASDLDAAVAFLRKEYAEFRLDPTRIAIGGFAAGATTAINVAYGMGTPVNAVIALSAGIWGYDLLRHFGTETPPPALLLLGQQDLDSAMSGTRALLQLLGERNVDHEFAWVPGFGHYYPGGAVTLSASGKRRPAHDTVAEFLYRELRLAVLAAELEDGLLGFP